MEENGKGRRKQAGVRESEAAVTMVRDRVDSALLPKQTRKCTTLPQQVSSKCVFVCVL